MTTATESVLTYPSPEPEPTPQVSTSKAVAPQIRQDRLYVGNLHPTVDEYTLVKAFERFGKITSLDFLFHKSGPSKGKPRGYAFIEYSNKDEALKAIVAMHDKLVRGRNLVVTFAHQAPPLDDTSKTLRKRTDTSRPTALSLMKSKGKLGTEDKIAALEAKLAQIQKINSSTSVSGSAAMSASLPPRPPPSVPRPARAKPASGPSHSSVSIKHAQPPAPPQSTSIVLARGEGSVLRNALLSEKKSTPGGLPLVKSGKAAPTKLGQSMKRMDLGIKKLDTSLGIKKKGHKPCDESPSADDGK